MKVKLYVRGVFWKQVEKNVVGLQGYVTMEAVSYFTLGEDSRTEQVKFLLQRVPDAMLHDEQGTIGTSERKDIYIQDSESLRWIPKEEKPHPDDYDYTLDQILKILDHSTDPSEYRIERVRNFIGCKQGKAGQENPYLSQEYKDKVDQAAIPEQIKIVCNLHPSYTIIGMICENCLNAIKQSLKDDPNLCGLLIKLCDKCYKHFFEMRLAVTINGKNAYANKPNSTYIPTDLQESSSTDRDMLGLDSMPIACGNPDSIHSSRDLREPSPIDKLTPADINGSSQSPTGAIANKVNQIIDILHHQVLPVHLKPNFDMSVECGGSLPGKSSCLIHFSGPICADCVKTVIAQKRADNAGIIRLCDTCWRNAINNKLTITQNDRTVVVCAK